MMSNKISRAVIQKIEKEAKEYFRKASGCHDFRHVERVLKLALYLGRREKADLGILEVAALLHDIGRREEIKAKGAFCHAEAGSALAQKILEKYKFNKGAVRNIVHCIRTHRFRDRRNVPKTIEAKALFDADKLDSIGAVGLGRAFLFAGGAGSGNLYTGNERRLAKTGRDYSFTKEDSAFLEYEIKLKKIKDVMLTASGRRIALARHRFMVSFWQQFWQEVAGKK